MPTDCISYQKSGYFSKLIVDYLDEKPELATLYNHLPKIENFKKQIEEKAGNFNGSDKREVLVRELEKQYEGVSISVETKKNIQSLLNSKTFTVTTGHQLNLFTGPLYFLYKIASTINLCTELKEAYPEHEFVPIYWMATEDHDFEEINHFNFKGKNIHWNKPSSGPVGRLSTEGLDEILAVFTLELGSGNNANEIKKLFQEAYLNHPTLTEATRYLANTFFSEYGLVILDGDSKALKQQFTSYIKEELIHQSSNKLVLETIEKLQDYTIQVNPREINLFYIEDDLRERILFEDGTYKVNNTDIAFTETEILAVLQSNPEKFSPNVILRPLYQEVVLPNLCYIGGGGEIAYWLELKSVFDFHNVTFPSLLIRNSVVLVSEKQQSKIDKLGLNWSELFLKQQELITRKTKELSSFPIDLSVQKLHLEQQFETLEKIALQTDKSFTGAVHAQKTKQINGLENLEKRLLKAQKRKFTDELHRIISIQNELFPNQSLQERQLNFSEFYLNNGRFISLILKQLHPLDNHFLIFID
ncbi:bacillithiol biosynthesis cysteine-adding enzyme BshC [Flavobacterium sp.]|uniref:bacillithiol biosynthesis cysteine-adding enzyme BshC n=1 Tax=Flavobacterium sp. TaxID=239 RepID=UPI00260F86CE|nr:bacillithiol biosynthesis cysteine-adding enzyme BshC [Flavobacterium sp.]